MLQLTPTEVAWLLRELRAVHDLEYSQRDKGDADREMCEALIHRLASAVE